MKVLFLCVHNAGRSQMALGWFRHLAGTEHEALSGGSEPLEDPRGQPIEVVRRVRDEIEARVRALLSSVA